MLRHSVTFVGAGPGAEDLITLRGLHALEQADVVLYAGSLVNPELLKHCPPGCLCLDSASMTLEEQIAAMAPAARAGKRVVRLHTGDPSLYGAVNEQIRGLARQDVASTIVPGVSSVFGAAAALGCELTCPGASQSVVLTRTPGRTPMPEAENAAAFARTGSTLVFFLSTGNITDLMDSLQKEGQLAPDTPAAVAYRATWPDERILRGTVSTIARQVEEAGFGRQALIFVGRALAAPETCSHLYGAQFSHGYRNSLPGEAFDGRCALYAFTDRGLVRAREIAAGLGLPTAIFTTRPVPGNRTDATSVSGPAFDARLAAEWPRFDAHIFIGATGIAVRRIAPLLQSKISDPAVLACSENGSHVVSLTSGHLGGANRLARRVARVTGGQAVVSTATDVNGLPAFDEAAAQEHARILNAEAIRPLNAALLSGEPVTFCGPRALFDRHFSSTGRIVYAESSDRAATRCAVLWDTENHLPGGIAHLDITSRAFVLGVGCRRGVEPLELRLTAEGFLADSGLSVGQIAAVASCDIKADEPAVLGLAAEWGVPLSLYPAEKLAGVPVPTPSEKVLEKVGTASVCEAACLLAAGWGTGPEPRIWAPKAAIGDVTLALARLPHRMGKKHGSVVVAGLGSGSSGQITPEVSEAIRSCDTVAGYGPYVDFIRARIPGKPVIQNGMTGEVERCRATLEAAAAGQEVCMVCSGDPGILAMAGLLFELRDREAAFAGIPIRVLPGITAANLAAASLGAPLQNGFSLVSLSDLLVPTDEVRRNLCAVAQSDLPVALYNPAGRRRRILLAEALRLFREQRGNVICALAKHAGRPEETLWTGTLDEFPADAVDMSSLVIIGGPRTKLSCNIMYEARGYAEKYLQPDGKGAA